MLSHLESRVLRTLFCTLVFLIPFLFTGCLHIQQDARSAHRFQAIPDLPSQVSFNPPTHPIDPSGPNPYDPTVAVVEFNEQGNLWTPCEQPTFQESRCQPNFAAEFIQRARKDVPLGTKLVVLTFIHGWRHDALWDDANFSNFREAIDCLNWGANAYATAYADILKEPMDFKDWQHLQCTGVAPPSTLRYVGVYIGWQGTTPDLRNDAFTLLDRYPTAGNTAGEAMFGLFQKIREAAKGSEVNAPIARLVFMGHSFGALIVERTARKILDKNYLSTHTVPCAEGGAGSRPWTELFLLINSADTASTDIEIMQTMKDASFCSSPAFSSSLKAPWLVSIHSDTDVFTGNLGTIGRRILRMEPKYGGPDIHASTGSLSPPKKGFLRTTTLNNDTFFLNTCYIDSESIKLNGKGSKTGDLLCDRVAQQINTAKIKAFKDAQMEDLFVPDGKRVTKADHGAFELTVEPCFATPPSPEPGPCRGMRLTERDQRWTALNGALAPFFAVVPTGTTGEPTHLLNLYTRLDVGCYRRNKKPSIPGQPVCLRKSRDQPVPPGQLPWNATPYWAFNVPDDVISGHDGFWTDSLTDLVISLLQKIPDVP